GDLAGGTPFFVTIRNRAAAVPLLASSRQGPGRSCGHGRALDKRRFAQDCHSGTEHSAESAPPATGGDLRTDPTVDADQEGRHEPIVPGTPPARADRSR